MRNHKIALAMAAGVALLMGTQPLRAAGDAVAAALGSVSRIPADKARDADLHAADILRFAEIKPGEAVVDLVPDDGYFSRLFSRVVGPSGHVYPLVPLRGWRNIETQRAAEARARREGKTPPLNPIDLVLPIQAVRDYRNVWAIVQSIDWYGGNFGLPQQLDVVFTTNAYHTFHNRVDGEWKPEPLDMIAVNKAIYRAMKPGGRLIIADYAAAPGSGFSSTSTLQRSDPQAVKAEVVAAGFAFESEDRMYANADDDHSRPAADAALHGKPDRYVLKFRKPRSAPATDRRPGADVIARYDGNSFILGKPDSFMGVLFYHRDGAVQETMRDGSTIQGTWYWDADGHNCEYHEAPYTSLGFVTCHPFPPEALRAKPGDTWLEVQGRGDPTNVGLLRGIVYPKPGPLGEPPPPKP